MSKSPITTHVLDTSLGRPAEGVGVELFRGDERIGRGSTNADGRVTDLIPAGSLTAGVYRIAFETGAYFLRDGRSCFYPRVEITFEVKATGEHYHVPLLLNPFGYSTYRGS